MSLVGQLPPRAPSGQYFHQGALVYSKKETDDGDGYLSDVPTQASLNALSDASADLIHSTRALEQTFRDRYNILRSAYEARVKSLGDFIQETCASLFTDELLHEMKNDRASASFIPAHLSELMERHLEHERERFVHHLTAQLSLAEAELVRSREKNSYLVQRLLHLEEVSAAGRRAELTLEPLRQQLSALECERDSMLRKQELEFQNAAKLREQELQGHVSSVAFLRSREEELVEELDAVSIQLSAAEAQISKTSEELNALRELLSDRDEQLRAKDAAILHSAQELTACRGASNEERTAGAVARSAVERLQAQREALLQEVASLSVLLSAADQRSAQLEAQIRAVEEESTAVRSRARESLQQMQALMSDEAEEAQAAVAAAQERMVQQRARLQQEAARERRLAQAMNDELLQSRVARSDAIRELGLLRQDDSGFRQRLNLELTRSAALEGQLNEALKARAEAEAETHAAELAHTALATKIVTLESQLKELDKETVSRVELAQESVRLQLSREFDALSESLKSKQTAELVRVQNEVADARSFILPVAFPEARDRSDAMVRALEAQAEAHAEVQALSAELSACRTTVEVHQHRLRESADAINRLRALLADRADELTCTTLRAKTSEELSRSLAAELDRAKAELEDTRRRAVLEREEDRAVLVTLRTRFEALMQQYSATQERERQREMFHSDFSHLPKGIASDDEKKKVKVEASTQCVLAHNVLVGSSSEFDSISGVSGIEKASKSEQHLYASGNRQVFVDHMAKQTEQLQRMQQQAEELRSCQMDLELLRVQLNEKTKLQERLVPALIVANNALRLLRNEHMQLSRLARASGVAAQADTRRVIRALLDRACGSWIGNGSREDVALQSTTPRVQDAEKEDRRGIPSSLAPSVASRPASLFSSQSWSQPQFISDSSEQTLGAQLSIAEQARRESALTIAMVRAQAASQARQLAALRADEERVHAAELARTTSDCIEAVGAARAALTEQAEQAAERERLLMDRLQKREASDQAQRSALVKELDAAWAAQQLAVEEAEARSASLESRLARAELDIARSRIGESVGFGFREKATSSDFTTPVFGGDQGSDTKLSNPSKGTTRTRERGRR